MRKKDVLKRQKNLLKKIDNLVIKQNKGIKKWGIVQADIFIQNTEVVNVPNVIIAKPINTSDQENKALRNIASVMEKIIETEFGRKVKIELRNKIGE